MGSSENRGRLLAKHEKTALADCMGAQAKPINPAQEYNEAAMKAYGKSIAECN